MRPTPVGRGGSPWRTPCFRIRLVAVMALVLGLLAVVAPVSAQPSASAMPSMTWPTVGRETQPFGCTGFWAEPRRGTCAHFHGGIDIANKRGTPIRAAAAGTIQYVGREPWYHGPDRAWVVVINHGHGVVDHLRAPSGARRRWRQGGQARRPGPVHRLHGRDRQGDRAAPALRPQGQRGVRRSRQILPRFLAATPVARGAAGAGRRPTRAAL